MHKDSSPPHNMTAFTTIWLGQLFSLIGSGLTSFALGVWTFQTTNETTQLGWVFLAAALPGIIISPLAGALVDRWDRRKTLIMSDAGSVLGTLLLIVLFYTNQFRPWHVYLVAASNSLFSAFQWPAYSAVTTILVPKKHLGRASGMIHFGQAAAQVISPLIAGVLMTKINIQGVILIDLGTFLLAIVTLLFVNIPSVKSAFSQEEKTPQTFWQEIITGWKYLIQRPSLIKLLAYIAILNFAFNNIEVLIVSLVLKLTNSAILGTVQTIAGIGMIMGSVIMSIWGGPKKRMHGIFVFMIIQGLSLVLTGSRADITLIVIAQFISWFTFPIISGCNQAVWQTKIPPEMQGRVFATRRMIATSLQPIAYLVVGPLADYLFEPLLVPGGLLANSIGRIIGVGADRGIGLYMIILGLSTILATGIASFSPRLRLLEKELPDHTITTQNQA